MAPTPTMLRIHFRWMISKDMSEVLSIECTSTDYPWTDDEFLTVLRTRCCVGMVAEEKERVVGFMIYQLEETEITLLNFAVAPEFRRCRVGQQMMAKIRGKLSFKGRRGVETWVRETDLDRQRFFRSMGWLAVEVERGRFPDSGEDGYRMVYGITYRDGHDAEECGR